MGHKLCRIKFHRISWSGSLIAPSPNLDSGHTQTLFIKFVSLSAFTGCSSAWRAFPCLFSDCRFSPSFRKAEPRCHVLWYFTWLLLQSCLFWMLRSLWHTPWAWHQSEQTIVICKEVSQLQMTAGSVSGNHILVFLVHPYVVTQWIFLK